MSETPPHTPRLERRTLALPQPLFMHSDDDKSVLDPQLRETNKLNETPLNGNRCETEIASEIQDPVEHVSQDRREEKSETDIASAELDEDVVLNRLRRPRHRERPLPRSTRRSTRLNSKKESPKPLPMPPLRERLRERPWPSDYNGRFRLAAVSDLARADNMIREIENAFTLFRKEEWLQCQTLCLDILVASPSEAVMAKAHMILGALPVECTSFETKFYHLEQSLQQWSIVIGRHGSSRFPVDKARVELDAVQAHVTRLRADVEALSLKNPCRNSCDV